MISSMFVVSTTYIGLIMCLSTYSVSYRKIMLNMVPTALTYGLVPGTSPLVSVLKVISGVFTLSVSVNSVVLLKIGLRRRLTQSMVLVSGGVM